ncbi:MAG: amino-acid N-acetyltransferase [Opitutales bacterium]|nr:amino-acid N-acetyltransferase [Opitutales bacterium]
MADSRSLKPTDLRGILKYVPMFREHTFVIAIDGSIVAGDNFENLVLDIAVLRSLNINVVIVHGIGLQLREMAAARGLKLSDVYGEGRTDEETMKLAREAVGLVSQRIVEGMTHANLKCAITNAIRATQIGVIGGVDMLLTGKVEKIDVALFKSLLAQDIIPVVTPILCDRDGVSLRVNSDSVAADLAVAIGASKLIYLSPYNGLEIDGDLKINLNLQDVKQVLKSKSVKMEERVRGKAQFAVAALEQGIVRAHILDGRRNGGLLAEIFDKVGTGTMIHANEYDRIRPAKKKDAAAIYAITKNAVRNQSLVSRKLCHIEEHWEDYFVYEIDGTIIGCACLRKFEDMPETLELCSVYVQPFYQNRGVGRKLIAFSEMQARERGARSLLIFTTQTYGFFHSVCKFVDAESSDLPPSRLAEVKSNGRNSKALVKRL